MIIVIKQLLSLGVPLAIGYISQMMISFTDAALVAHLGVHALSGTMLALSLFSFVMLLGLGIITAIAPKLAQAVQKNDGVEVKAWFDQGLWLGLFVGLVSILVLFNSGNILSFFGQEKIVTDIAQQYNSGAAVGIVFFYFYVHARGLLSAIGQPKLLTFVMLCAVVLNFIISWLLIFGVGSIEGLGVFGAGLASTVVRILIAIGAVMIVSRNASLRPFRLQYFCPKLDLRRIFHILTIGLPIGIRILISEGFPSALAFMVIAYGAEALAAHSIGMRLDMLISVVALGISSACTTISAWYQADMNVHALRQLRLSVAVIALVYAFCVSLLLYCFYGFVLNNIFGLVQPELIRYAWQLLPFIVLSISFGLLGAMLNGILVSLLDTFWPTVVITISYWGLGLGGGAFLASFLGFGFFGYWIGLTISGLVVSIFNYMRVSHVINAKYNPSN